MAKFLDKCKEVGKDMVRVIKEDPANTALDVIITVLVGGHIFLSRMAGYYQGRIDFAGDLQDELKKLEHDLDESKNGKEGGDAE